MDNDIQKEWCGVNDVPEQVMEIFSKRLKKIRTDAKLTQQQFADKIGVSVSALSYYETGKRIPDIVLLAKICIYFNISSEYFLGETNSIKKENVEVSKITRLSDKAIENAREYIENTNEGMFDFYEDCDILNKLLENEEFYKVLDLIAYCKSDCYYLIPDDDNDYLNYIISRKMIKVISDISHELPSYRAKAIRTIFPEEKERIEFLKWLLEQSEKGLKDSIHKLEKQKLEEAERLAEKYRNDIEKDRLKAIRNIDEANKENNENNTKKSKKESDE